MGEKGSGARDIDHPPMTGRSPLPDDPSLFAPHPSGYLQREDHWVT